MVDPRVREAAADAAAQQMAANKMIAAEEDRLAYIRSIRKTRERAKAEEEAGWMKGWAEDEKNQLQSIIGLEKELTRVKEDQEAKAKTNFSLLARERAMMTHQERGRAEKMYADIEAGGLGAWEGMGKKQRDWYAGTSVGQQQLGREGIFEAQAERDAGWLKSAARATPVQIDAAVRNEIVVRVAATDKETAGAIISKTVEEMLKFFEEKRKLSEFHIANFMKRYAELEAASAATGGNK